MIANNGEIKERLIVMIHCPGDSGEPLPTSLPLIHSMYIHANMYATFHTYSTLHITQQYRQDDRRLQIVSRKSFALREYTEYTSDQY